MARTIEVKQVKAKKDGKCLAILLYAVHTISLVFAVLLALTALSVMGSPSSRVTLPSFAQDICLYFGIISIAGSIIAIAGVRMHITYILGKQFNVLLCLYLLVAIISAGLIILGGAASIAMTNVIQDVAEIHTLPPRTKVPSEAVKAFEVYSIESIATLSSANPERWLQIQGSLSCCGYTNGSKIDWYIEPEIVALNGKIQTYEAACHSRCYTAKGRGGTAECPSVSWCKEVVLGIDHVSLFYMGLGMILYGSYQVILVLVTAYFFILWYPKHLKEGKSPRASPRTRRASPTAKRQSDFSSAPPDLEQGQVNPQEQVEESGQHDKTLNGEIQQFNSSSPADPDPSASASPHAEVIEEQRQLDSGEADEKAESSPQPVEPQTAGDVVPAVGGDSEQSAMITPVIPEEQTSIPPVDLCEGERSQNITSPSNPRQSPEQPSLPLEDSLKRTPEPTDSAQAAEAPGCQVQSLGELTYDTPAGPLQSGLKESPEEAKISEPTEPLMDQPVPTNAYGVEEAPIPDPCGGADANSTPNASEESINAAPADVTLTVEIPHSLTPENIHAPPSVSHAAILSSGEADSSSHLGRDVEPSNTLSHLPDGTTQEAAASTLLDQTETTTNTAAELVAKGASVPPTAPGDTLNIAPASLSNTTELAGSASSAHSNETSVPNGSTNESTHTKQDGSDAVVKGAEDQSKIPTDSGPVAPLPHQVQQEASAPIAESDETDLPRAPASESDPPSPSAPPTCDTEESGKKEHDSSGNLLVPDSIVNEQKGQPSS